VDTQPTYRAREADGTRAVPTPAAAPSAAAASTSRRRAASRLRALPHLPHEIAFALFFVVCWAGVAWTRGPANPVAVEAFGILAAYVVVLTLLARRGTRGAWSVRLGMFVLVMGVAYNLSGAVVHAMGTPARDPLLERIDTLLFGMPLPLRLQPLIRPWLTDLLSACYAFHYPYVVGSALLVLSWWSGKPGESAGFYAGLFTVFAIGFLGYIIVPAAGPYLAIPELFHTPLGGGLVTRANAWIVASGSNAVDVFPSLHTGASLFILAFQFRHTRRLFYACVLPVAGLVFATLYLRYHYGIDVLAGLLLAALGLLIAEHTRRSRA